MGVALQQLRVQENGLATSVSSDVRIALCCRTCICAEERRPLYRMVRWRRCAWCWPITGDVIERIGKVPLAAKALLPL
jgi:hypothetical protein